MTTMTSVATPASRRIASSIPAAAVGTMNGRPGRPAVAFSSERRPDDDQADEQQRVRPVPELAPEPPDPGEAAGRRRGPTRKSQPPSRATSGRASRRPNLSIVSSCSAVTLSPRRTIVSFELDLDDVWGSTPAAARSRAASVSVGAEGRVRDDQRRSMISAASVRSVVGRGRPPSGRSGGPGCRRPRARGAPRSRSRRGRATPRRGPRPTASEVRRQERDPDLGRDALERRGEERLRSSWVVPSANAWSTGRTRWSNRRSCSLAISTAPAVV